MILENIEIIQKRIRETCARSGRNPDEVKLLLATKTVPAEKIIEAFQSGETLIGENKVQELKEKYDGLKDFAHQKHFIGHLQSNKIKDILKCDVACVQSIDRLSVAEKLQQRLEFENKTIDILVQVNTSGEESKFGVKPENALDLVKQISKFDRVKIKGLMTIGLFSAEKEKVRLCFKLLKYI